MLQRRCLVPELVRSLTHAYLLTFSHTAPSPPIATTGRVFVSDITGLAMSRFFRARPVPKLTKPYMDDHFPEGVKVGGEEKKGSRGDKDTTQGCVCVCMYA
jgi:hypothetical protein